MMQLVRLTGKWKGILNNQQALRVLQCYRYYTKVVDPLLFLHFGTGTGIYWYQVPLITATCKSIGYMKTIHTGFFSSNVFGNFWSSKFEFQIHKLKFL